MRGIDYLLGVMRSKNPGRDAVEDPHNSGTKTPQVPELLRQVPFLLREGGEISQIMVLESPTDLYMKPIVACA